MAATYPTTIKSFAAIVDGVNYPQAADINQAYDEIVAVETALLNGLGHDLKFTDATYDIGKSGATRPRDGFFSRNGIFGGTLGVTGLLTATAGVALPGGTLANYVPDTSWTPVIGGSGGTSGQAYSSQIGKYARIGDFFIGIFSATLSTKGTVTGSVILDGLPIAPAGSIAFAQISFLALNTNQIHLSARYQSATSLLIQTIAAAGTGEITGTLGTADLTNTSRMDGLVVYFAA